MVLLRISKRGNPLFRLLQPFVFGGFFTIRHESEGKFVFLGKIHLVQDNSNRAQEHIPFWYPSRKYPMPTTYDLYILYTTCVGWRL